MPVFFDGVPLNDAVGGVVNLSTVPLSSLGSIEVYRGSTPITFPTAGIGGVLSLKSAPAKGQGVQLTAGGGSYASYRLGAEAVGTWAGAFGQIGVRGWVGHEGWRGDYPYFTNGGTAFVDRNEETVSRQNNDFRQTDGLLRVDWRFLPNQSVETVFLGTLRQQGVPGRGTGVVGRSSRQALNTDLGVNRQLYRVGYRHMAAFGGRGHSRRICMDCCHVKRFGISAPRLRPLLLTPGTACKHSAGPTTRT